MVHSLLVGIQMSTQILTVLCYLASLFPENINLFWEDEVPSYVVNNPEKTGRSMQEEVDTSGYDAVKENAFEEDKGETNTYYLPGGFEGDVSFMLESTNKKSVYCFQTEDYKSIPCWKSSYSLTLWKFQINLKRKRRDPHLTTDGNLILFFKVASGVSNE
ncbi:unnamed protein product [Lactuca saligna]|uniref:Uncharacterized protein n=1 Tax=Lactuca saligna TaxID=75948 RepID=A0AA35ZW46_LACSI|nr:unnamed protein product [Lactuca saligna]